MAEKVEGSKTQATSCRSCRLEAVHRLKAVLAVGPKTKAKENETKQQDPPRTAASASTLPNTNTNKGSQFQDTVVRINWPNH